ncbi:MFS transporter [Lactobacillus sp. ESL0703]|uniref:MFS transporter n=1 Tax=Lactobacillus sp. ESL0703 TaxID=2983218 RepID=UPI0023F68DA0|nr:MFS transporter [Lactobacillus sp. ESL0703]MDF7669104.1 MFS transporter [Lactobacillus sp. ESL0703]
MNKLSKRIFTKRKITLWTAICYGLTDFSSGGAQAVQSAWMLFFYTSFCNLSATQGASIIAIGSWVTALFGLVAGGITDNFYHTKLGKMFGRRHFFLIFGSPFILSYILLWFGGLSYWYYFCVYLAFLLIQQMITVPYSTLPNEMTTNFKERTLLSTTRLVFAAFSNFFASFIPAQLFKIYGQHSSMALTVNGIFFAVFYLFGLWLTAFNTWEMPVDKIESTGSKKATETKNSNGEEKQSFWKLLGKQLLGYLEVFRVKAYTQQIFIYLLSFTGFDVMNMVFTYYVVYCLHSNASTAGYIMSFAGLGFIGTIIGGWAVVKFGPRFLYSITFTVDLITFIVLYTLGKVRPANAIVMLTIIMLFFIIARAIDWFLPWNMYPFMPDLGELVTGENKAGTFQSVVSFVRGVTSGLSGIVIGMYLDNNGFMKNAATQPLHTQNAILNVILFGSGTLILIALIISLFYKLNKKNHKVIVDEIARLRAGGKKADATNEVKKVTKDVIGVDYSKVWPVEDSNN